MSIYLVAAYIIFWALTFILVLSLWARQRRIEKDLKALQEEVEREPSAD